MAKAKSSQNSEPEVEAEKETIQPEPEAPKEPRFPDNVKTRAQKIESQQAIAEKLHAEAKEVVYVEADGNEYPAKIVPLPTTKGIVIDIPQVTNVAEEYQKLAALPLQKQAAAFAELNARIQTPAKALSMNNEIHRLAALPDGTLCKTTQKDGREIPAPDLLIDYGGQTGVVFKQRVRHEDNVAKAAKGEKQVPFFRFLALIALLLCGLSAFAVDSGAVTEGTQTFNGRKNWLWMVPESTVASGTVTLNKNSHSVQIIDANGAGRTVILPPESSSKGWVLRITNSAAGAFALTVKNSANTTTIATINQYQTADFYCDGTTWTSSVYTSATTGFVAADGSTTGATGQSQVFTSGVTTDAIVGNTATPLLVTGKIGVAAVGNAVTITGGAGAAGANNGGAVNIVGGASGAGGATGNGGAINLTGTVSVATNGDGGAVVETAGAGNGSGAGGARTSTAGAGGATGIGGSVASTAGRGGSTSGAAGTWTGTAGAGGASSTVTGGAAAIVAGASGGGATGNGGLGSITGGAALSTNGTGGGVTFTGGAGAGTGVGGVITLTPGAAGASANAASAGIVGTAAAGLNGQSGGFVNWTGGAGQGAGLGGAINIVGGLGGATNAVGGAASITAGQASGTGNGAVASVTGGASGAGGATGTGGVAKLVGGASVATNGTGGAAQVTGGAGAGNLNGGQVVLTPGAAGGTGVVGNVSVAGPLSSPVTAAQTLVNGNTITLPTSGRNKLLNNAGAITGVLMTAGRFDGEEIELINPTANSFTFAAVGTSLVADGVSAVIAANTRMRLVWDATSVKWYHGN